MNGLAGFSGRDLIFFVLVVGSLFAALVAILQVLSHAQPRRRLLARAKATRQRLLPSNTLRPSVAARARLSRDQHRSRFDTLATSIVPKAEYWRRLIARAGTPLTFGSFAILAVVLSVGLGAAAELLDLRPLYAWPLGVVLALLFLRLYLARLIAKRTKAYLTLLPDAIGLMVRGIKSGLPVSETILVASREVRNPLGEELRRIADQMQLGRPLEEVMSEAAQRIDLPEVAFMSVAFSIQRETGGNLAEMLENLDSILRRRRHMQLKIRAYSGEARASAMIIGALPFILIAILAVVDGEYIATLFTTSMGHIFLAAAGGCIALGVASLVKLTRFPI